MLFNTVNFALFFGIIVAVYWLLYQWKMLQNLVLVLGSGYFYYCFKKSLPIYLYILIGIGYISAIIISKCNNPFQKKAWLTLSSIIIAFGLAYIKYSGLILGNIPGLEGWQASTLHLIVPIGISYFTFSSIGYITDVYRNKIEPETNFITYAAYISYFPHILSGPIPSSSYILPQFNKTTILNLEQIEQSIAEIIWGLYKKMVVAENMVIPVNYCFAHYQDLSGSSLFIGVTSFSIYLYADFSGYSDIAMAISRLLGIELTRNFQMPFFSRNPGEFWRRWHTSLRKWMLDYIYLPLGGNKISTTKYILLILFIFSFSGLWHGANLTFIFWGLLNGIYFIPYILTNTLVRYNAPPSPGKYFPTLKEFGQMLLTFNLVTFTRILFGSPDIFVAKEFFIKIFSLSFFETPMPKLVQNLAWCIPMLVVEWMQREKPYFLATKFNFLFRIIIYIVVIATICYFCKKVNATEYYYFKF